jgi:hypothetical protein
MKLQRGVVCALLMASAAAFGQTKGTISGYITDRSGAVIPNAKVSETEERTGAKREVVTNETGFYQFLALGPGNYTIEAEAPNFKRYENTGVILRIDQNIRVDISMEVGAVAESVSVTADAAVVDTRSSAVGNVVDDRRIIDLPLQNRNVIGLAALLPGVAQVNAPSNSDQTDSRSGPTITVNGGRRNQNYETLNGTYFNNPSRNTGLNVPPPDAIQEFRIQTSNYSADSGRNSGSIVNVATRAGTNDLHGSVWEFHRNSELNARSFFQGPLPKQHANQFGGAAGGPVKRDKVFIFGAYEGLRDRRAANTLTAFPPSAAERAGDFSGLSQQLKNPFDGTNLPGNQIPASLMDPVAQKLLSFVPVLPPGSRLISVAPAPRNSDLGMLRNDWTLSQKQTLFVHYFLNQNEITGTDLQYGTNVPGWMSRSQTTRAQNIGLNHTYIISPSLLNQVTLGFTRSTSFDAPGATRSNASLGIAGFPDYTDGGASQFNVSGRFVLASGGPVKFKSNNYDLNEGINWTRGSHTLKFGFQYLQPSFFQSFLGPPSFSFNGTRSGDPLADFLVGAYRNLSIGYGVRVNDDRSHFYAGYFQDDWKVKRRLTINYGLRYEVPTPWVDKYDHINTIDTRPGVQSKVVPNAPPGMLFPGDLPRGLYPTDRNNFAPRFGFAYDITGDGKTAVRGAWGLFYETLNADSLAQENAPYASSTSFVNGRLATPAAGHTPPPVVPDAQNFQFVYPINLFFLDGGLRTPYIQQWNFTLERQMGKDISIEGAYVAKIGRKLQAYRPFNVAIYKPGVDASGNPLSTLENAQDRAPFYPGIYGTEMIVLSSAFNQFYHSAQFRVNKRFSRGFNALASYTLGKSIDDSSDISLGGCIANPYDLRSERGRANYDARHVLAVSWLWTPVEARGGTIRKILGGWNISGIHTVHSGYPFTVYAGDDYALGADICGGGEQHPNLVGNPVRSHSSRADMVAAFFNPGAYAPPAVGTYGSAGRNIVSGPGFSNSDFALLKDFSLTEAHRFQFRAEFFNAFNQVNFSAPRNDLTDARVGQLSGAAAGRAIQFGLKFIW